MEVVHREILRVVVFPDHNNNQINYHINAILNEYDLIFL